MEEIEKKYVVLDVETNGLSSLHDDLLSVSIYKPDDNKLFDRFLPLELNSSIYTTHINGITKKKLKGAKPFSQEEIDNIIKEFELDKRIILTYGDLDERFIKNYLKRKKLKGYEQMTFYNFKHDIISSPFGGNVTKDNLCRIYGIDNVKEIHSGANDCLLEWQLFKKMNGNKLLITGNNVFELNNEYIIPASYLSRFPNFKYCFDDFPKLEYSVRRVKSIVVKTNKIKKFDTNISGVTIEHLINTMLNVKKIDSYNFLVENKRKLKYIGRLPSIYDEILATFNSDGTITAMQEKDEQIVKEINKSIEELKKKIGPVIEYIKTSIFKNKEILSQELVISKDKKVLAQCDLSNEKSVLEIKTYSFKMEKMKYQLYYESNGRNCYVMNIDWGKSPKELTFTISKVNFKLKEDKNTKKEINQNKNKDSNLILTEENYKNSIRCKYIEFVEFDERIKMLVKLHCKKCNATWLTTYQNGLEIRKCPFCGGRTYTKLSETEKLEKRTLKYKQKIKERSNGNIEISNYKNSRENVRAKCLICNHEWNIRADHLLERCYCPNCRK